MTEKVIVVTLTRDPDEGDACRGCPFFHSNSEYPETWCTEPEYGRDWGMGYYDGGPAPKWCAFRQKGEDV